MPRNIGREVYSHISIETAAIDAIDDTVHRGRKTIEDRTRAFRNEYPRQFADIGGAIVLGLSYDEMRILLRCIREYGQAKYESGKSDGRLKQFKLRGKITAL